MVDTNVIVDMLGSPSEWSSWSFDKVSDARIVGAVAISSIVVAELAVAERDDALQAALDALGLAVVDFGVDAAYRAGRAHREYRAAGGGRERLLGDFLIGAHAKTAGAALLTRDARRYRRYFPDLTLITPETDA
jgi:predicted nucleic acid-binding protein